MGQTILKVDFQNKKVIINQQNNSYSFLSTKKKFVMAKQQSFKLKMLHC